MKKENVTKKTKNFFEKHAKKIIYGILIILWLGIMFYLSHQSADKSSEVTVDFASQVVETVGETVGSEEVSSPAAEEHWDIVSDIFNPLRKFVHFFQFFVLGLLFIGFVKEFKLPIKEIIIISLMACFICAVGDEIHQMFVPGRAGTLIDILLDFASSTLAICLVLLFNKNLKSELRKVSKKNLI